MTGRDESFDAGLSTSTSKIVFEEEDYSILNDRSLRLLIENQEIGKMGQNCLTELRDNDRKILLFLLQDGRGYRYTFNGLARQLKIHQQSLARSLHRLVKLGIVEKSNDGYNLAESKFAQEAIWNLNHNKGAMASNSRKNFAQLIQAYIPLTAANNAIIHSLIGKRFGTLRWLGIVDSKNECCLRWGSDGSSLLVVVRIISCYLVIETNALTDADKVEALVGGCRIFGKVISMMYKKFDRDDYALISRKY